jgi:predicted AAA+ superfamily ATPase
MNRSAYQQLIEWKNRENRKPLIVQGARQVGKTYLINEFGRKEYANYIYLNFEQDSKLHTLFSGELAPEVIVNNIGLYIGEKITSKDTLLFFDEIQASPHVLTSLKYFQEQAPEFHVIAAGSLLGVSIGKGSSFPVGKVNFLNIFPMSFLEYLIAIGEELLAEKLQTTTSPEPMPDVIHEKALNHFKLFLFLGGMPEVIQNYINNKDIVSARQVQNDILEAYKRDFSKYTEKNQAIRVSEFWNSIPRQLEKENKKFKYNDIRKGARASSFEQSVEWLRKAGIIHVVYNISTPKMPLSAYADYSKFKVYMHDVGLLAALLNISSQLIISPTEIFSEFNGAFIENFIAQELSYYQNDQLHYWTSKSDAEVDFVIESEREVYPVEVKSGMNRNIKSLRSFSDKYNPKTIFRISPRNLTQDNDFINIPLYATNVLINLINKESV